MTKFNFRNYLYNQGFSFTNLGTHEFFSKSEIRKRIYINIDKLTLVDPTDSDNPTDIAIPTNKKEADKLVSSLK